MKISLITVCFNSSKTIEKTIESVLLQQKCNLEYIVIDGASQDNTLEIIQKYSNQIDVIISEKDNGIYDAINKGINLATGDYIGILNSDDIFTNQFVLSNILKEFTANNNLDCLIGDICFVNDNNKIIRYYTSKSWIPGKLKLGLMPPHPSFYCKRSLFQTLGNYRIDFKIAADYELFVRYFLINKISYKYLPSNFVTMKIGGVSTKSLGSNLLINKEVLKALKINKIQSSYFLIIFKFFLPLN